MYMKSGDEYGDGCFNQLSMFIKMLDAQLLLINNEIRASRDPDSEGLCDLGEYFIGYGFIAIQRYINSTYKQNKINRKDSLKYGFKLFDDLYLMEVLDEGANYWKHEPEWPFNLEYSGLTQKSRKGLKPFIFRHPRFRGSGGQKEKVQKQILRSDSNSLMKVRILFESEFGFSGSQKKTLNVITRLTPRADYTLSNLFAEILDVISPNQSHSFNLFFKPILPFIEQWRNDLDRSCNLIKEEGEIG